MTCIDPGHGYSVTNYDGSGSQRIQFMKRIGSMYPGNYGEPACGTNMQELIRVLIDRLQYLHNQIPHWTNPICIFCMRLSINLLELRAAFRHGRKFRWALRPELLTTNAKDGHVRYGGRI